MNIEKLKQEGVLNMGMNQKIEKRFIQLENQSIVKLEDISLVTGVRLVLKNGFDIGITLNDYQKLAEVLLFTHVHLLKEETK